jgi:hypothetical protein
MADQRISLDLTFYTLYLGPLTPCYPMDTPDNEGVGWCGLSRMNPPLTLLAAACFDYQQVPHIGRGGAAGNSLEPLLEAPTANVDISFLTSPWQSGQSTLVSCCITSLSKVWLHFSQLYSKIGILVLPAY